MSQAFLKYIYLFFALWSTISRSPKDQPRHIIGKNRESGSWSYESPPLVGGRLANAMADRCPKLVVDSPSLRPLSRLPSLLAFHHSNRAELPFLHTLHPAYAFHTSSGGEGSLASALIGPYQQKGYVSTNQWSKYTCKTILITISYTSTSKVEWESKGHCPIVLHSGVVSWLVRIGLL